MLLHTQIWGDRHKPHLVFLHGFLGNGQDWQSVIELLVNDYCCITLDLPGHGKSASVQVNSMHQSIELIEQTLIFHGISRYLLIGYSLGARHAAFATCFHLLSGVRALLLEGANLGGLSQDEKQQRLYTDTQWANILGHQPLQDFLQLWYQQSVFSSLSAQEQKKLIEFRLHLIGDGDKPHPQLAKMLLAASLAKQPDLRAKMAHIDQPIAYVVGNKDKKFSQLVKNYPISDIYILNSGHNGHLETPEEFAQSLVHFIQKYQANFVKSDL